MKKLISGHLVRGFFYPHFIGEEPVLSSWKTIQIRLEKIVKTNRKTTIFCGLCNKLSGLRKETLPQGRRGRSDLPRVLLPPLDVVVQYHRRAHRVEDAFPLCAEGAALVEEVSSGAGGLALVPHPDGQAAPDLNGFGQLTALAARSPSVPSMFSGRPMTMSSASISFATSQTLAATCPGP
mgnify:CR=1 FL=1